MIRAALQYDRRKKGSRGRALIVDLPRLGLRRGDRLEPGPDLVDVALFDSLEPGPACNVTFWRRSLETMVRRRNPLFSEETGITPDKVFMPDWLHDLALGVDKWFVVTVYHRLVGVNAFAVNGALHQESVGRIREMLHSWYDEEDAAGRKWARCPSLKPETFGLDENSTLGLYGEETLGLLHFAPRLLQRFGDRLPARDRTLLERLGNALIGIHAIIVGNKQMGKLPAGVAQERQCQSNT